MLKWLLPDAKSREARLEIAKDHLTKILARTKMIHSALDQPEVTSKVPIHLIAGDSVPTPAISLLDEQTGKVKITEYAPGDGTVLRTSALLDERTELNWNPKIHSPIGWSRVSFLFTDHLGLTKNPNFTDNLLFELLEQD